MLMIMFALPRPIVSVPAISFVTAFDCMKSQVLENATTIFILCSNRLFFYRRNPQNTERHFGITNNINPTNHLKRFFKGLYHGRGETHLISKMVVL